MLEREVAGFGASGRNGGWCVGDYGGPVGAVERDGGPGSVEAMAREMHRSVDEVGAVVASAGIDCGWHKGGALYLATNAGELKRVQQHHAQYVRYGIGDAWTLLDASQTESLVHVAGGARGALVTPHAAAVHPARLARGLAVEVERLGGVIHEGTAVRAIDGHRVRTDHGTVQADVVVRATEAYTGSIEGQAREVLPLGNHVIATEPIDDATWAEIGLASRPITAAAGWSRGGLTHPRPADGEAGGPALVKEFHRGDENQLGTFGTRRAAAAHQRAVLDGRAGTESERVGEYLERVWLPSKKGRVETATLDRYRWAAGRHIVPLLGAVRLAISHRRCSAAGWPATRSP